MEPCQDGTLREFTRLYKEYDSIFHSVALAVGLSDSALTVLYHPQELGDGCLQRDIAASAWVSKQTVHSTIRQLRERGLLSLSPGKGRDMHIHLTEEGRRLVREEIYPIMQMESDAFQALAPEERRDLLCLTARYVAALRELAEEHIRRRGESGPH